MKHFLSESAIWHTQSEFVTPDGRVSYGEGKSVVSVQGMEITNESWVQLEGERRTNNYKITQISQSAFISESLNPELGKQIGVFNLDRSTIFSKFEIEGTSFNGYEIIRREKDVCFTQGALYDNDSLINTWSATMRKIGLSTELLLKPVEDSDVKQLEAWLHKAHVLAWYHDADVWLNEIQERNGRFSFLNHYIVLKDDIPIGFGQYYDCFDAKEDWYSVDRPSEIYSIDYFIGEEEYLRKGFGKEIIRLLINEIYKQSPKAQIIVQPENENIASCKALLANGFIYTKDRDYYILNQQIWVY